MSLNWLQAFFLFNHGDYYNTVGCFLNKSAVESQNHFSSCLSGLVFYPKKTTNSTEQQKLKAAARVAFRFMQSLVREKC